MAESFTSQLPAPGSDTILGPEILPSFGRPPATPTPPLIATNLKPIDPNARASLGGFKDEWSGFADAPAENFDSFANAPDAFAGFETADDLDVRTVEDLNSDREKFNPVTYFSENPDVARNPARLSKLLATYRKRREEGFSAPEVAKAAVKETPGLVGGIAKGALKLVENGIDVVVQPIFNAFVGTFSGDMSDPQKRRELFKGPKKSLAEISAGSESAAAGLVDIARQGLRKLENRPGEVGGELPSTRIGRVTPPPQPKSDQELLAEISADVEFRKTADEVINGGGEVAKTLGLDSETLQKQGITLDKDAIQNLSLVDPVTLLATGGAFKLVGVGGRVIATARTLEAAEQTAEKFGKLARFTGGALEKAGKVAAETKGFGGRSLTSAGAITGALGGGLAGGLTGAAVTKIATKAIDVFALPTIKEAGAGVSQAGKIIAGKVPLSEGSAGVQRFVGLVEGGNVALGAAGAGVKALGTGAAKGAVAAAPFALAADEDATAGALLGVGVALGAGGAVVGGSANKFRILKNDVAQSYFGKNRKSIPDVPSPEYGRDAALDQLHSEEVKKLSVQDAAELNNFREGLRNLGGEIYAVDRGTFRQKVSEVMPDATPEQLDIYEGHSAFFDTTQGDKKVVYLNSDATGLRHDAGHIFDAVLSPEKRAELRAAVENTFTPEQRKEFRDTYERRVGNKISDKAAVDEFIAETFGALFHNVPVSDLAAPKSLLKKFAGIAAEGAEALGIDLTGGIKTPNLQAPQTIGLRSMFEYAARDVLKTGQETVTTPPPSGPDGTPPNVTPLPPTPPPSGVPPTAPPTNVVPLVAPPANVVPLAPARPIRPSGTDLPAPVTPEARAAAAKRFSETGIEAARQQAKSDPVIARAVEDVSVHMESGNPVLEIDHLGVVSKGTPDSPEGRTSRRATQAAGYEALKGELSRAGAPDDLVASHLKTFVPVRWTKQGGTPTLIAMSLDKALQNIRRLGSDEKAAALIPYPTENGKLTPQGWRDAVSDLQAYAENQANGRRGDGGRLTVPEAGELSIPVENPSYTPQPLTPEKANFANLVQGLETPETARPQKGKIPGNVKGQILAEANQRAVEIPTKIPTKQAGKQAFIDFPPRVVQEVNPLRNRLKEAGVNTGELIEVTERIRAIDIEKVTPRPDINFRAPVTDIIRGGFQPAPTEFRQKNLQGRTVEEFSDSILRASPTEWKAATDNMTGGLTGGAWNLGLGLKNQADVAVLKSYADKFSDSAKASMQAGDFDSAFSQVTRGQFFREAYEAATGTGSAGAAFKRGTAGMESAKPPFPITEKTQATATGGETTTVNVGDGAQFLPRTDSGRALEKQGFKIRPSGKLGVRGVEIFDRDNNRAGEIISDEVRPNEVSINNVLVRPSFRGKGIGEALYRELAARLKEDGVTTVIGDVVAPEPLALRRKVFGEFETLDVDGQPASIEDALTAANMTRRGVKVSHVEPTNKITAESQFLPAEQLDFGTVEQPPELRIVPRQAAAAGGTPPIEPPTGTIIPPPVAAGFLPAEELETELPPNLRVLPAAPGGRPPTGPTFRPPPVAVAVAKKDEEAPRFAPAPDEKIRDLAKSYAADAGIPYAPKGGYAEVKPDLAKKLADFYEQAKSDPTNPEVAASYDALIKETEEQGKGILAAGYKIEPWTGAGEPYKSSAEAIADVRNNKHLYFRTTEGAGQFSKGNPMLAESSLVPGQTVNDVFRWVHDFFGHSKEGFQFGPRGEFNAWRAHSEMYSPEAQGALAAETLAQNSWVNYGPKGKDLPQAQRPFAEQKNVVVPKELIDEASFQPRTDAGRKLEKRGYEIVPSGEMGIRKVTIKDPDGAEIAQIQAVNRSSERAEILFVNKLPGAPKGIGEVLYRELGAQLKEDGVTELTGTAVAPEPLAIRRKIFGGFKAIEVNGEPTTYAEALATAGRIKNRTENEVAAVEPVNDISSASFMPAGEYWMDSDGKMIRAPKGHENAAKEILAGEFKGTDFTGEMFKRGYTRIISSKEGIYVDSDKPRLSDLSSIQRAGLEDALLSNGTDAPLQELTFNGKRIGGGAGFQPRVKRDAQGRPLKKSGEIDYRRWQAEGLAARKKQEAETIETPAPQGRISEEASTPTGWILPDKTFVPLDTAFHEGYLAENAKDLNKKFGTALSETPSVGDRLDALNAGFVRFRYDPRSGNLLIEANASKWPKFKPTVKRRLQDYEERITGFTLSLLNNKALQVDSVTVPRMQELSGPQKLEAIDEAIDSLRVPGQ